MSGDNHETTDAEVSKSLERFQEPGVNRMSGAVYWLTMVMGSFGIFLAINQTFRLDAFGTIIIDNSYYYILIAVFLSLAFLILPARKKEKVSYETGCNCQSNDRDSETRQTCPLHSFNSSQLEAHFHNNPQIV